MTYTEASARAAYAADVAVHAERGRGERDAERLAVVWLRVRHRELAALLGKGVS